MLGELPARANLESTNSGEPRRKGTMGHIDCLTKYLEEKGNTSVIQIGAFFQWKTKDGANGSASVNQIHEEWKAER